MAVGKTIERPFGQRDYNVMFGDVLKPTMIGEHYKFILLLPRKEYYKGEEYEKKDVFADADIMSLRGLLQKDFGGVTVTYPSGDWVDKEGRTVINDHAQFEISCQKNDKVLEYFAELKARLLLYADEEIHMPQEEILVQRSEINLGEDVWDNPPLEELKNRLTKLKERINNLKR